MMKRSQWLIFSCLSLLPILARAADAWSGAGIGNPLNFTPPPSDISVVFLGNIFGIVDGILSGSGSQIMGEMFRIFNAAVLSLGGIVFLYTITIGVLNTAHEGEVLGSKYSTIWVPLKLTAGVGLLLPKASGYCYMQIFVMWIVVQGVGAADKVWSAALDYLQRGGVIVQQNLPTPPSTSSASSNSPITGAGNLLQAQVCLNVLGNVINQARSSFNNQAENNSSGPCYKNDPSYSFAEPFCKTPFPQAVNSVNITDAQQQALQNNGLYNPTPCTNTSGVCVPMPNFPQSSPYAVLNGVCGTINFQTMLSSLSSLEKVTGQSATSVSNVPGTSTYYPPTLSASLSARGIAIQQMFNDLAVVASSMVNNNPSLTTTNLTGKTTYSTTSYYPFGIPQTSGGQPCTVLGQCVNWGAPTAAAALGLPPLFNGTELLGAVTDYNAIMLPTLNAVAEADNTQLQQDKEFITEAKNKGWILAGSYFFNLAQLNQDAMGIKSQGTDSYFTVDVGILSQFPSTTNTVMCSTSKNSNIINLCKILQITSNSTTNTYAALFADFLYLIKGTSNSSAPPTSPSSDTESPPDTVFKFIANASSMTLPGQAGMTPPTFTYIFNPLSNVQTAQLPEKDFSGGWKNIGGSVADILYNKILVKLMNWLITTVQPFLNQLFFIIFAPLLYFASALFNTAVSMISQPELNPIISLANMGAYYINQIINTYLSVAILAAIIGLIPILGVVAIILLVVMLPVMMAFYGVMFGIGVMTAYYIPLVPYILFTFGAFGWMISVVESMVAAPIVALGITHPQGEGPFGRAEPALMILLNVFLRPSMMIVGFIFGIILSYVGVWLINAGFQRAMEGMLSLKTVDVELTMSQQLQSQTQSYLQSASQGIISADSTYTQWAGAFSYFFLIIIYTSMYIAVVQKAFTMIHVLPDRVLRYLEGGRVESFGSETAQLGGQVQQQVKGGGQALGGAAANIQMPDVGGSGGESPSSPPSAPEGPQSASSSPSGGGGGGSSSIE